MNDAGPAGKFVAMVSAGSEYLVSLLRLQGFHLETASHEFLARALRAAAAILIGTCGLVFVSIGAVVVLGESLRSTSAGWLIVGGIQFAGAAGLWAWSRARDRAARSAS